MKNKTSINLEVSLVEIIFSILIFAIAGAITLNCFAVAKFTQLKANDKVEAGNIIQSSAEIIKSADNIYEMNEYLSDNFKHNKLSNDETIYFNYYDGNWNLCDEQNEEYSITIEINDVSVDFGDMKDISMHAEKVKHYPFIDNHNENSIIYEINTKKFFTNNESR